MARIKHGLLPLIAMTAILLAGCAVTEPAPERAPNVVVLFADDLGYGDLASYGHPYNRTPNLDELAAGGQRWTDFYVAAPVCSPSRGALLTGRLPVRTGLYGERIRVLFPNDTVGVPEAETTLAEALKQQGYATGIFGKWHLGDAPETYPTRHGFDEWFGIPYSNDMRWTDAKSFDELMMMSAQGKNAELQAELASRQTRYFEPKVEYWQVPLVESSADGVDNVVEQPAQQPSLTKRYTERAVAFMEEHAEQPFFVYVPYTMPHTPIFASEAFSGRSRGGRYGDVIEEIDWSVGQIVAALKRLDLSEDTLILFSSDNGPWRTMRHHGGTAGLLKDGKGTTFEGGVRVPAIFSWPGRIQPGVVSDIGSTLDVVPTVLALLDVESTAELDGVDLADALFTGKGGARQEMPYYRNGTLYAYRKGPYKLHLITEGSYGLPPERTDHEQPLLYHLPSDPGEQFDLAAAEPEIVRELVEAVAVHRASFTVAPPLFDLRLARLAEMIGGGQ